MTLSVWKHRNKLHHTLQKVKDGRIKVGFIGGSITDARPRHNWPEPVISWLAEQYPQTRISVENAAIGATGSDLAAFRAKRDLIDTECDLVFVEYAVNDENEPTLKRNRTREGLIRQLLASGQRDIVIVYTYSQNMYEAMQSGAVPDTISEFERIAEYYQIGSVWMGLYALEEVKKGRLRFEEWLPDGLHPTSRGSLSYGQSVITFLTKELLESDVNAKGLDTPLPEPLDAKCWDKVYALSFDQVQTSGPWVIRRWPHLEWIDQVLETAAVGAGLSFRFEGRGLALGFDFGRSSAEFRYRVDGGEWQPSERERPSWLAEDGWYRLSFFGDDWSGGAHLFELEVMHGNQPNCTGTNFRLAKVGIIQ
ncbi:SGNH/GDSL hydrolase family protein [Bacillus sp. FJAT-26390]|uniref:SGNH/GDSL hydrolase family protein n=1 Tax=Bacillus sp. FJAT-26390 TaxID=1743142 RepID=UPI000807D88C|nr:SGNH/GDSL hydrolase family protein [Bacillus sp. FJAT-26390]OBZ13088.1 hypothetical protein A7975_09345 [Bacillus sp. FJAT-26390]